MVKKSGVLVGAMIALGVLASPAGAAERAVNCGELQTALNEANSGDKITLNGLCKGPFPYKLPAIQMTLAGTPGAGFDGGSTVQLEGSGGSPTIEGLIFENAHSTAVNSGGALSLNISSEGVMVRLGHDTFLSDVAGGGEGGGARINTGSADVTVTDSTFSANSAATGAGALAIYARTAHLSGDTFTGNSVTGAQASGGALLAFTLGGPITLASSQFSGNSANNEGGGALLAAEAEEGSRSR